ncbi:hypothetical protein RJ640_004786 [Escallonia rubra]|uniref:Wax synthase domain-containing protein n=1 Tax=Escallonia rubra TaxID=112253 RepID=A0AA88UJ77_9ASTE|nr:hypothetical protein RJ640_004786 [Escallonia rubra]
MDGEIKSFIKVWLAAMASLCYCYCVAARIPKGTARLISILPVIYLFIILPFSLSSFHLGAPSVFYLVWLANFKLLLFSFNHGPLSSPQPFSLLHFTSIALLPIKTKQDPSPQSAPTARSSVKPTLLAIKVVLLAAIVRAYDYRQNLHTSVIMALYCCHVYLGAELVLGISAFLVRSLLGLEPEPQFNEPYLATSLQDFWGRRWNLMVPSILRPAVYDPLRRTVGLLPAYFATFLVSGLMHEIIYFYLTRASPTWEVTWFFVLHGVCTAAEVAAKKALAGRWRLHRAVSGLLTVGFVAVTGVWLFLPQVMRNGVDQKAIKEYSRQNEGLAQCI